MENEIQPSIPPVQPLSQTPTVIPPSASWLKILLFTVLGLVVVAGSVFIGIQIGRNQVSSQQTVAIQSTATPTSTNDPTANWKTYTDTEYGFSFRYPNDWKVVDLTGSKYWSVGPSSVLDEISKNLESYKVEGGYALNGLIASQFYITGSNQVFGAPNEYWKFIKTSMKIDNKNVDKYVGVVIKNPPNSDESFIGNISTEVVIPLSNGYLLAYSLDDENYTDIFNQILSTFKLIN